MVTLFRIIKKVTAYANEMGGAYLNLWIHEVGARTGSVASEYGLNCLY